MLPQSGYLYRFHTKVNRNYLMAVEPYLDGSRRTIILEPARADKDNSVFLATEDPRNPGVFNLRLASSPSTYLTFPISYNEKNEHRFDDGQQIVCTTTGAYPNVATWRQAKFKIEYADHDWPNHPDRRTPDGTGWARMSCEWDTNHVVDLDNSVIQNNQRVNSWTSNGTDAQQWWPERVG